MSDNDTNQNGESNQVILYSNMSPLDAQERLGFEMQSLNHTFNIIPFGMLDGEHYLKDWEGVRSLKEKVYSNIVDYLGFEGYPSESTVGFCDTSVSDLVFATISPILSGVRVNARRDIRLRRNEEIVSVDGNTGGTVEFVMVHVMGAVERRFVLIESEKSSLGRAMQRCLLSMKDIRDKNGAGEVYGFITTGESWRMFKYDGIYWKGTRKMDVVFEGMENDKNLWLKENSTLVEGMIMVLSEGAWSGARCLS